MPGPFNSDKIKGVFERDTACIKQNDVWSSATFNKFAKTVYNVFYDESAYSRVFHNPEKPRLMLDCSNESSDSAVDSGTGLAVKTPNIWFHDNKDKNRIEMRIVDRNFDVNTNVSGGAATEDAPLFDAVKKRLLFSGRGDMSVSSKPYALFQVLSESLVTPSEALSELTGSASDASNVMYNAYCCITYEEGFSLENNTNSSRSKFTPKYSSLSEITFKFDPNLSGTVISRVEGDKVRVVGDAPLQEDVDVKLTLTFGPEVALSDFVDYMNGLTTAGTSRYKAVIVGQALEGQSLISALIKSSDTVSVPTEIFTKTIRFVPIRPCIAVLSADSAESFETLTCPEDGISSLTEYTMRGPSGEQVPVFVNTGTYGFIISNSLAGAPVMHDAADLDLVYIPNKNAVNHYTAVESTADQAVPSWYDTLPGRITRAVTENFNEEFFFVPYITVTDRTIEIGDFSVDISDLTHYGDTVYSIEHTSRQPLRESMIEYDSYAGHADSKLLAAAGKVFNKIRSGVKGFYSDPNTHELNDLESTTPWVNSLARTLQFMTGCTWDLNNTVILDPELEVSVPVLKMFRDYPDLFKYEQSVSGRGTILTVGTTVIYVARSGQFASATISVTDLAMLPCNLKHIAVSLDPTCTTAADSSDFTLYGSTITDLHLGIALPDDSDIFVIELRKQDFSLTRSLTFFSGEYTSDPNTGLVFTAKTDQRLGLMFSGGYYSGISAPFGALYGVSFDGDVIVKGSFDETSPLCAPRFVFKQMKELIGETLTLVPSKHSAGTSLYEWNDCNGAKVDIKLLFRQELKSQDSEGIEMRNLSAIHSLISINGVVENCDITLRIKDTGNTSPWTAPDRETVYPAGTWQAFDPDFFLKPAADNNTELPDYFPFIDCGSRHPGGSSGFQGKFVDCKLSIDLSEDMVYYDPWRFVAQSGQVDVYETRSAACRMFFSSRIFRKTPYLLYFCGTTPDRYVISESSGDSSVLECSAVVSDKVTLSITAGEYTKSGSNFNRKARIAIGPVDPSLKNSNTFYLDRYLTYGNAFIFLSGLSRSTISIDRLKVLTTQKAMAEEGNTSCLQERWGGGGLCALFESVPDCDITIGHLDTLYRLVDEWKYGPDFYSGTAPRGAWKEPANGFLFFVYPKDFRADTMSVPVNRNCKLRVGRWDTRQLLSGIYGLYDSEVDIAYNFTTQSADLLLSEIYSPNPEEIVDTNYPSLNRPMSWGLYTADPGAMRSYQVSSDTETHTVNYLPGAPLFYLAEVHNSKINITPTTFTRPGNAMLGSNSVIDSRKNFYKLLAGEGTEAFPSFKFGFYTLPSGLLADNKRRPLRLALGYVLSTPAISYDSKPKIVASSTCNKISGLFTRVNIVCGVLNHVSGWCFRLFATSDTDHTPPMYHKSTPELLTLYDLAYPQAFNYPTCVDGASGILDAQNNTPYSIQTETSCDLSAPMLMADVNNRGCPEELEMMNNLAFWSGETGRAWSSDTNAVHGSPGGSLGPLYQPCTSVPNSPYTGEFSVPPMSMLDLQYAPNEVVSFGSHLPAATALNTTDLKVILIATSNIRYTTNSDYSVIRDYVIWAGTPMHTVAVLPHEQTNDSPSDVEIVFPGFDIQPPVDLGSLGFAVGSWNAVLDVQPQLNLNLINGAQMSGENASQALDGSIVLPISGRATGIVNIFLGNSSNTPGL